ncbi:c-type cytochrome [Alkalimarinus sediminis]|uniref:Cytochrome c n=1 Tax=Alkalimarinus sediminis TaxID=1632866 RepID=A0A9E8HJC1_9ALTE|nr:cytochrome c [Alkalimarinus sediminis]UZW75748.1 cytochrome c [Alkalimarinus sediminis]
MAERFTKSMARNIYLGGSTFFILLFLGLTFDTMQAMPERDNRENLTESVANGKLLWEENNCLGCHSLLGEGAYFAPELGNVFERRGMGNEEAFVGYFKAWMNAMPTNVPGRRQMPQFNLTDQELEDLAAFFIYVNGINTNDWPPNVEG